MIYNKRQGRRDGLGLSGGPDFFKDPRRACNPEKSVDPDWWYAEDVHTRRQAMSICRGCIFRQECDAYATQQGEQYGVWGARLRTGRRSEARREQRQRA